MSSLSNVNGSRQRTHIGKNGSTTQVDDGSGHGPAASEARTAIEIGVSGWRFDVNTVEQRRFPQAVVVSQDDGQVRTDGHCGREVKRIK
jgi:hypothetical protein